MITSGQIEYHLLLAAKRLAKTGLKQARVIFSSPRWKDYVDRIANLAELASFDLGLRNLSKAQQVFEDAERMRNLLAHSAWFRGGTNVYVQWTRGIYQPHGAVGRVNRVLDPQGIHMDAKFRKECLRVLRAALAEAKRQELRTRSLVAPDQGMTDWPSPKINK